MKLSSLFRSSSALPLFFSVCVFFLTSIVVWSRLFPTMQMLWRSFSGETSTCSCAPLFSFSEHPFLNVFFLVLFLCTSLIFLYAFFVFAFELWRLIRRPPFLASSPRISPPPFLADLTARLGLADRLVLVDYPHSFACTVGLFRPRIFLSSSILRSLEIFRLEAILLHEKKHLLSFDPLFLFALRLAERMFLWIPGWRKWCASVALEREVSADAFVVSAGISSKVFRDTLLSFATLVRKEIYFPAASFSSALEARLAFLTKPMSSSLFPRKFFLFSFLASLFFLFFPTYSTFAFFDTQIRHDVLYCPVALQQTRSTFHVMSVDQHPMSKDSSSLCERSL